MKLWKKIKLLIQLFQVMQNEVLIDFDNFYNIYLFYVHHNNTEICKLSIKDDKIGIAANLKNAFPY